MKTIISPDGNRSFLRRNQPFPAVKQVVPHRETVCFTVGNISAGTLATSGEKDAGKVRPERDTNYR
jgi:hypothetical protein